MRENVTTIEHGAGTMVAHASAMRNCYPHTNKKRSNALDSQSLASGEREVRENLAGGGVARRLEPVGDDCLRACLDRLAVMQGMRVWPAVKLFQMRASQPTW